MLPQQWWDPGSWVMRNIQGRMHVLGLRGRQAADPVDWERWGMWLLLHPGVCSWRSDELHENCQRLHMAGEAGRGHFIWCQPQWESSVSVLPIKERRSGEMGTCLLGSGTAQAKLRTTSAQVSFRIHHLGSSNEGCPQTEREGRALFWSVYKRLLRKGRAVHHPLVPKGATATFPLLF